MPSGANENQLGPPAEPATPTADAVEGWLNRRLGLNPAELEEANKQEADRQEARHEAYWALYALTQTPPGQVTCTWHHCDPHAPLRGGRSMKITTPDGSGTVTACSIEYPGRALEEGPYSTATIILLRGEPVDNNGVYCFGIQRRPEMRGHLFRYEVRATPNGPEINARGHDGDSLGVICETAFDGKGVIQQLFDWIKLLDDIHQPPTTHLDYFKEFFHARIAPVLEAIGSGVDYYPWRIRRAALSAASLMLRQLGYRSPTKY